MMRPRRWIACLLLAGVAVTAASYITSMFVTVRYNRVAPPRDRLVQVNRGVVHLTTRAHRPSGSKRWVGWSTVPPYGGLNWWPLSAGSATVPHYALPLWIPAVCCLIPGLYLWRTGGKTPVGHCQGCGYNLTGNESGTCPECGKSCE